MPEFGEWDAPFADVAEVLVERGVASGWLAGLCGSTSVDVLVRLARDPDGLVRSHLAHGNEAPPAELLLAAAEGYWTDPDPKVRRLALYAADCTPETVERLADDPDRLVHEPAAADPRLPAAALRRLLDTAGTDVSAGFETNGLRRALARNPALPVPVLIGLLRDREQAGAAAANPAIPVAVALRMIDLAAAARE
ncbi:hypothetical protein ACFV6F_01925 [Kitasatospora phosalacinea]|uniref:hypothetical protein n=1 Tax=Kitasatospora phosalacinea TaxID=2065 RepID=UPI003662EA6A